MNQIIAELTIYNMLSEYAHHISLAIYLDYNADQMLIYFSTFIIPQLKFFNYRTNNYKLPSQQSHLSTQFIFKF
jgi:hypothetical protein